MKTQLTDRTLWYDGTCEVDPTKVPELMLHGVNPNQVVVTTMNEDIKQFNLVSFDEVIEMGKSTNADLDMEWNIPREYHDIDLSYFILKKAEVVGESYVKRAELELHEIKSRNLEIIFKTLIFIVDQLEAKNQVWGVGRGSSCASLVLFLIGVHEVDPVKYNIPATEFYHD